jgi:UDP-2,3-diacylglucosamine pyrophosphatase LpxH
MLRAVLADLHLNSTAGDLDRFAAALSTLRERGVGEVVFLGDLFRTLIGLPHFWDGEIRRGLGELERLRGHGARVVVVEGNRDFYLDRPEMAPFLDLACDAHSFATGGRRFLLEHGDLLNRRDRSYRLWRAVSKSGVARAWARALPAAIALRIISSTEARLARTNFSYRRELPLDDLAAAAIRHFAAGVDVVMWGHFHRAWRLDDAGKTAMVLPSWGETGAVIWIDEDGKVSEERPADSGYFVDSAAQSWYQEDGSLVEVR